MDDMQLKLTSAKRKAESRLKRITDLEIINEKQTSMIRNQNKKMISLRKKSDQKGRY